MITTNTPLADLFPSRWLKPKDLTDANVSQIAARVDRVTIEDVKPQPAEPAVQRLALHLHGHKPYLVTSKADTTTLAEAYGAATPADLVGKVVAIKLDVWHRQAVLRIAPPPRNQPPAQAKPTATSASRPPAPAQPPATMPPPVATAPAEPPTGAGGGVQTATAAPLVAPLVAPNGRDAGAVELWPPREPWVSRKRSTGEVDWVTTFWQCGAALKISRSDAQVTLQANGGSFEDAARDMWEQHLGKDRDDEEADDESFPAF